MADSIIVPISAPGGDAAALTTRKFGVTLGEAAIAHDKLTGATVRTEAATTAEVHATKQATLQHEHRIRTIQQETLRLKAHEEQLKVTRAAEIALGESVNATDISKLRRFASRSLGGGLLGEVGRGTIEGIEGMQGSGLAGGLGWAGAGVAGGAVAYEGMDLVFDKFKEAMEHAGEIQISIVDRIMKIQGLSAGIGAGAVAAHGTSMATLTSNSADGADDAKAFMKASHDKTGMEAYAYLLKNGASGKGMSGSESLAINMRDLLGGTVEQNASKINPGMIQAMNNGMDPMELLRNFAGMPGKPMPSIDDINKRLALRRSSKDYKDMITRGGLEASGEEAALKLTPLAETQAHEELRKNADPASFSKVEENRANWGKDSKNAAGLGAMNKVGWFQYKIEQFKDLFGHGVLHDFNENTNDKSTAAGIPAATDADRAGDEDGSKRLDRLQNHWFGNIGRQQQEHAEEIAKALTDSARIIRQAARVTTGKPKPNTGSTP